jgi:hypothetical protein
MYVLLVVTYHATNLVTLTTNDVLPNGKHINFILKKFTSSILYGFSILHMEK